MGQLAEKIDRSSRTEDKPKVVSVGEVNPKRFSLPSLFTVASAAFLIFYAGCFYDSIRPYWFHPAWTTDDALQQIYPFHEVQSPGLFKGDLITEVMTGYLAPVHYWLSYGVTMLTRDPIMTGHWVMLIQVALTLSFLFFAVRRASNSGVACLAVAWLLHTRNTMQRLTGGLPRGWSAPVFTAFLYFALSGNHIGVLCTILIGCLTNPPSALVVAFAYGLLLTWRVATAPKLERRKPLRDFISYIAVGPLFALITLAVIHRPPHIGQMVSFDEASKMVEFSRPYGRFPFIPLNPASDEIRVVGLQAFVARFYRPSNELKEAMPYVVGGIFLAILSIGAARRRRAIPPEVLFFGVSALVVYALSRLLAFKLYVPDRHLQIPLAVFFVTAFTIGAWRVLHGGSPEDSASRDRDSSLRTSWASIAALAGIGLLVWFGSGSGLGGTANFNYAANKRGSAFEWMRNNTPERSLIAGHPTHIDPTQLFAARRAFVTTETTHPFYTRYYAEMKRRTEIALRAHYSRSLAELVSIVEPEGIDYFVFKRSDFFPENLPKATFFPPFDALMSELTSRPPDQYAYRELPPAVDVEHFPFMPFKDRDSAIVDIKALKEYLARPPAPVIAPPPAPLNSATVEPLKGRAKVATSKAANTAGPRAAGNKEVASHDVTAARVRAGAKKSA